MATAEYANIQILYTAQTDQSQKLQREIANYRGVPYERLVGSPAHESSSEAGRAVEGSQATSQQGERGTVATGETKRKYRRHPKPDENAPERPPSAYVIFSNKIREEIKGENLSFTIIAKLVGDRWQKIDASEKEPYEAQAAAAKERYNIQLSAYKKTDAYKEYTQYLSEFKAKHAGPPEGKRPKLDKESSAGSLSAKSGEMVESSSGHRRVGSIGSTSSTSHPFPSPGGLPLVFNAPPTSQILGMRKPAVAGSPPQTESPPSQLLGGPAKLRSAISTQSSTSDDSWASRGDQADAVQRTVQLSLVTAPTVYQNLSSLPPLETSSSEENVRRSSRRTYLPGHRDGLPPINPDSSSYQLYRGSAASMMPTTSSDERWRTVPPDAASRPIPDLPRTWHPPLTMSQNVTFGTAQLPPLLGQERLSETTHDHLQRILPPPRLSSPRDPARALPSLSRAAGSHGQSSAGTPTSGGGTDAETPQLDRSESEAINTLAGLAATGARSEGPARQNPREPQH